MDGQVTAGTLVRAIPKVDVACWLMTRLAELCRILSEVAAEVLKSGMGPADVHRFECRIEELVRELARSFLEWCFNSLEPSEVDAMPQQIGYLGQWYRRLRKKTPHANVLTRFGNITLTRATYRQGSRGPTIAPLEKVLGIECGATPGAQDLVGRQVATAGSSQGRCIEVIAERTGAKIGPEKLRHLSSHLADVMEPQREACQVQQLEQWIEAAGKHGKNVTLAVSRDGVSLGIAPFGNFEMASVATISVYADGQRMGTVYLACVPEENQETLSRNLTSLLKAVIRRRGSQLGRIVYVSDAGKIETAYWKNVLRHLHVDGQRIRIKRIVDYYHASLRLTTVADALLLTSSQRTEWLKRVRKLLLEPGGWGRVMRSIAGMIQEHGINPANTEEVEAAKRYLHRYQRFMNYFEYRSHGSPIGSGIVESACKQIVTERLKLSGMRWSHAGARPIMTLRSILLSQTWGATFRKALIALPAVNVLSSQ
ncbi:MAG: hypothetical protein KDA96_04920 [Planctomycetaceae bacterium]|nr:hypothetical protein [Planctomycetaceae bacterium]